MKRIFARIGCQRPPLNAVILGLLLSWFLGCSPASEEPASSQQPRAAIPPGAGSNGNTAAVSSDKIKFKNDAGVTVFSIKTKEDGAKLVDAEEQELARFNLDGDKLKIKDPQDQVLGYVVGGGDKLKLKDARQETTLFQVQKQADGDWKLEDGQEGLIYKIKKREYGFEIEDAAEQSLAKIKVKDGKTSLRDAGDQTRYATKDPVHPAAVACLGFDVIESLALRAALFVKLNQANE